MAWQNWNDINVVVSGAAKQVQGAPAVVSWVQGQLHVFMRGKSPDANVYYGKFTTFWQWEQLPAAPPSAPAENSLAAVSWGPNRIDLFAVGADKRVYHYAWNGSKWDNAWDAVPGDGRTDSAPAAASWKKDQMDAFVRASNNQLVNLNFENMPGKGWKGGRNTGGHMRALTGSPAAAASGANRIDCFSLAVGDKRHLLHARYDGTDFGSITDSNLRLKYQWKNPDDTAGGVKDDSHEIAGSPAASSLPAGNGRVDVFARSSNNRLIHREFLNDRWTNRWEELGPYDIAGDPAAVSFGVGGVLKRIDCLALGNPGMLRHTWWS